MIQLYALDDKFRMVTVNIPYTNLQWTRRYYDFGDFSAQIPLKHFDESWAYIGSPDRKELGIVQKELASDFDHIQVSGFFAEKMLDYKACYPRYIGDAQKTETAVRRIFERYKDGLPIKLGPENSPLLGDRTQSDFSDDQLGTKLYSILESRECSYSVRYDFMQNQLYLDVWQGLDRTSSQSKNPFQTFSYEFGNVMERTMDFDDSDYFNYVIIPANADDNGVEQQTFYLDWTNGEPRRSFVKDMRSSRPEDGQSMADFKEACIQEAIEALMSRRKVESVDLNVVDKGYMTDYDLGDKCDVMLSDLGISMQTRIVEVSEVFKADGHTLTVGLGNKRISNIRRAVRL